MKVQLLAPLTADADALVRLDGVFYAASAVPSEVGGRGFLVRKLGRAEGYHVRVGMLPDECECECPGFLFRGYCRHILGLLALVRRGML